MEFLLIYTETYLWDGNVSTPVCDCVHSWGVCGQGACMAKGVCMVKGACVVKGGMCGRRNTPQADTPDAYCPLQWLSGGVSAQGNGCLPRGVHLLPSEDRMTHACENITFPQLVTQPLVFFIKEDPHQTVGVSRGYTDHHQGRGQQ